MRLALLDSWMLLLLAAHADFEPALARTASDRIACKPSGKLRLAEKHMASFHVAAASAHVSAFPSPWQQPANVMASRDSEEHTDRVPGWQQTGNAAFWHDCNCGTRTT